MQAPEVHPDDLAPPAPGPAAIDGLDPYQRVRVLLRVRGRQQRDLARALAVPDSNLSRALASGRGFAQHWPAIARFFGVSLDWLLTPNPLDAERSAAQPSEGATASPAIGVASVADQPSAG